MSIRPRFLVALGETRPVNDIARRHILTIISARYFHALDIPILEGRAFTDQDTASTSQVCIVNEEFVRRYLKGRDAIGTLVSVPSVDLRGPKPVVREIVGVIRQVKEQRGEKENAVEMYVPITQNPWYTASIVLQTAGNPKWFVSAVKAAIARVDKDQPVTRVRTMEVPASLPSPTGCRVCRGGFLDAPVCRVGFQRSGDCPRRISLVFAEAFGAHDRAPLRVRTPHPQRQSRDSRRF